MRWTHHRTQKPRTVRAGNGVAPVPGKHLELEQHAKRLRLRLQESGPAYSCFALYLASRLDALPAEYCREFALTRDSAHILSPAQVLGTLKQELGTLFDKVFLECDYTPFESTLITQSHYARLRTGAAVIVMLLQPSFYGIQNEGGLEFLSISAIDDLCGDLLPHDVITDFSAALRRKTELALGREAMELMARDSASFELLYSPGTLPELSTRRLLTFERLEEQSLTSFSHQGQWTDLLARRLCHVWLQQAVHGRCFPVDLQLHNIYIQEGKRIGFRNCEFVGLPSSTRENLSTYLSALMRDDPDKAAIHLLREMILRQPGRKNDADMFHTHFRQAAYFGMLEPILGTDSNALAQIAFQHWKTAMEHGYVPQPHLLCFYRGLFSVARIAKQLSPNTDALREGMEELQATSVFGQMREIMDWRYWYENADKFASAMVHLPRTFDDALSRASVLPLDNVAHKPSALGHSRRAYSAGNLIVLLVLLVLIVQLPAASGWAGKITPVVLMLAGLLVLRESN